MVLTIDHDAHEYVSEIVRQCSGECGGIGYVELIKPGEFYVTEFVLLPQDAGNWHVEFDGKDFIEEITRAANDGREDQLRLSWHSHHSMDSYFSTTDDKGVKEYRETGVPWLISLVYNKAGDVASRLDIFDHEVSPQITISDLTYDVDIPSSELSERVAEELKAKVKEKKKDSWNKQTGKKKDDQKKETQVVYPGWSEDEVWYRGQEGMDSDGNEFAASSYDKQAWSEEDYENVAQNLIRGSGGDFDNLALTMGFDPTSLSEEDRKELIELMEEDTVAQ